MTNALRVSRALVEQIGQSPAFRNRQVTLAHPGQLAEQELVTILTVRNSETARTLGKGHRREELTVELGLVAEVNTDDASEALDRAYLMLSDVEQVIGENPDLGLPHVLFAQVQGFEQRSFVGDGKRVVEITVEIAVTANKDVEE